MSMRREKEYTPEEAFAIILREVTPHWYGSDPLVVGVESKGEPYPQPLTPKVQSGFWVFFFVSATSPVFDRTLAMYRVWERRFAPLDVKLVLCFRGHYSYFNERKAIESWLKKTEITQPSVCDTDGSLATAFGVKGEPGIAILHNGQIVYSGSSDNWLSNAELTLHKILRDESPGLPLWPVAAEEALRIKPGESWELKQRSDDLAKVELIGNWVIEDDRITTNDSKAELKFTAPSGAVEFVARSLSDVGDPTRIRFDTQGSSFSDEYAGKDFVVDDEGNSSLVLSTPRGYSALRKTPAGLRKLRFRFPFAKVSPVAIYGIEFGD